MGLALFHLSKSFTFTADSFVPSSHVGDVSVPLEELLGTTLEPDARGLYPTSPDGKLIGDDFIEHSLNVQMENPRDTGKPTLEIRAKFTPYDALRQQFWRKYLRQYDIDESGAFSHLELFSALDSLVGVHFTQSEVCKLMFLSV